MVVGVGRCGGGGGAVASKRLASGGATGVAGEMSHLLVQLPRDVLIHRRTNEWED